MVRVAVKVDDNGVQRALSSLGRDLRRPTRALQDTGNDLLDEIRPLVPVLTGRLVDDLKAEAAEDTVEVTIGTTPRVGDYAAIINAREGFMDHGEVVAEDVAFDALTAAVDDLIRSVGLT